MPVPLVCLSFEALSFVLQLADTIVSDQYRHKEGTPQRLASENYTTWSENCHRPLLLSLGVWVIADSDDHEMLPKILVKMAECRAPTRNLANSIVSTVRLLTSSATRPLTFAHTSTPRTMWTILRQRSSQAETAMQRTALYVRFQKAVPEPGAPVSKSFTGLLDTCHRLMGHMVPMPVRQK